MKSFPLRAAFTVGTLLLASCSSAPETILTADTPSSATVPEDSESPAHVRLSQVSAEYGSDFCNLNNLPSDAMCKQAVSVNPGPERNDPPCNFDAEGKPTDGFYKWLPICTGSNFVYPNGVTLYRPVRVVCFGRDLDLHEATVRTNAPGETVFELKAIYDFPTPGKLRALVRTNTRVDNGIVALDIDIETRNNATSPWVRTGHGVTREAWEVIEVEGTAQPQQEVRLVLRSTSDVKVPINVVINRVRFFSPICVPRSDGTCE